MEGRRDRRKGWRERMEEERRWKRCRKTMEVRKGGKEAACLKKLVYNCIQLRTTAYYYILLTLLHTTVHCMLTKHPSLMVCDVRVLKVEASAELTVREKERLFVWLLW